MTLLDLIKEQPHDPNTDAPVREALRRADAETRNSEPPITKDADQ